MAFTYLILSLLAFIGLTGFLFYRVGQATIYRTVALTNYYSIPSILQNMSNHNYQVPSSIPGYSVTRNNGSQEVISDGVSNEPTPNHSSTRSGSIVYRTVTRRMTIVKNNLS
jgi:hypothetical protein